MPVPLLLALAAALAANPVACWTTTPFNAPAIPLAVRSPYLSTWHMNPAQPINGNWENFWTGTVTAWTGYAYVDGSPFLLMGTPADGAQIPPSATQQSVNITATQSTFVLSAGAVDITATFLSPVEPGDLVRQSLPFSYLAITATSNDGKPHAVKLYTDISAEWVSGNDNQIVEWNTTIGDFITYEVHLQNETQFQDVGDRIQYGSVYYTVENTTGLTYQIGQDSVVRTQFVNQSVLTNTLDTDFRAISDRWPVFAFAHDLGDVSNTSAPIVYSIGSVRDPAIQYVVANNATQDRSLYFWSNFSSIDDAIAFFMQDYSGASSRAAALDSKINTDASAVSADYAALVALSVRQAYAAFEITISKDSSGQFNTSDVMAFMKEISSSEKINTVDVLYATLPLFLYLDPAMVKLSLLPLLEYQATGQYPNEWAVHDIGTTYPQALGHNDGKDLMLPVEESGNMLIMTLSYVQRTNDKSIITSYFNLLDQWTQYLIANTLDPQNQLDSDVFAGSLANQTNLAVKGIIGIKAMSEIATIAGDSARSSNYSSIASSLISQWEQLATASGNNHLTLTYGDDTSWGLAYNLYADILLNTSLVPAQIYEMQSSWYATVANQFGVQLDTRHTYVLSNWEIWAAATTTTTDVRNKMIQDVFSYASNGKTPAPFEDWYDTVNGTGIGQFKARPVVGGHLALLALPSGSQPGNNNSGSSPPDSQGGGSPSSSPTSSSSPSQSSQPSSAALARVTWGKAVINSIVVMGLVLGTLM
ncbi:hypothetical protein CERSUDRAFT_111353 [Gelatoporia subvermispora B]|uniref:DUF1793-domain-containing protein n=1 Tax=Ceriporiopsis subvermispora (strain B) TaxID=914234 RepID=M2PVH3_CERS8|nr:hypothetical protein CERSUDRAFT_111353 [Gelatoporia subvermispora B]